MHLLRKILSSFLKAILYVRHKLYDLVWLSSRTFDIPVINIGNLNLGGVGKTPITLYLAELLSSKYKVAVLSRGYKRKTKGFLMASPVSGWKELGDEPYQLYRLLGEKVTVAVDENRARGIELLQQKAKPDVILLDDAFQHRRVKAGLNLLLTPYHKIFTEDDLFPAGHLRDLKSRAYAADMFIITKTPQYPDKQRKEEIIKQLKLYGKPVFFFKETYGIPENDIRKIAWEELKNKTVLVITGIARPQSLEQFLKEQSAHFHLITFPDHAAYNDLQIKKIKKKIQSIHPGVILTTEKDYEKLKLHFPDILYIPYRLEPENKILFNQKIIDYVDTRKFV